MRFALLICCRTVFTGLRTTTIPTLSAADFDAFLQKHYTCVVLHDNSTFRKEFEAAFSRIRGDVEIEDRTVQFATIETPPVNDANDAVIPNVAIYQGGARKVLLVDPNSCRPDVSPSLYRATQIIDFVTERILPRINPHAPDKMKSDAMITGYLLTEENTPIEQAWMDAFHGVMMHCWDEGSSSSTFAFALRTVDAARGPEITLSRRDGLKVEPFRDFAGMNLYFSLLQWTQKHARPKIMPATRCTKDLFFAKDVAIFAFDLPYNEVLADTQGLEWGIFTVNGKAPASLLERYGMEDKDNAFRGVVLERVYSESGLYGRTQANEKYVSPNTTVREAMELFNHKKLPRFLLSEPIPEAQHGHVKTIVGTTVERFASDSRYDVVMLFCAPWCGYCKKFEKQYEALAHRLSKSRPWVRFGKMDVTRNDNPWYDFYASPQLHLFPHNATGNPVYFDRLLFSSELFDEWIINRTTIMPPEVESHREIEL